MTTDRNRDWIDEFRANEGRLGGNFEGVPVLLLHDRDAATGDERITPLTCQPLAEEALRTAGRQGSILTDAGDEGLRFTVEELV